MPVQNVECQIARLQVGRFLQGEILPRDMMAQLEAHLGRCEDCRAELASRKEELRALAHSSAAAQSQEPARRARTEPGSATNRPSQQKPTPGKAAVATPPAAAQPFPWKLLGYSLALAAVLGAMSFLAKDPTALFGPRATDAPNPPKPVAARQPDQPFPTIYVPSMDEPIDRESLVSPATNLQGDEATEAPTPGEQPIESDPRPSPSARPSTESRAEAPSPQVRAERRQAEVRRPSSRRIGRRPAAVRPAEPRGTLRLYDEQGRPIQL